MNNNKILYAILVVITLGIAYLLFTKKDAAKTETPAPIPPVSTAGVNCIPVPEGLPGVTSALIPSDTQTFLGFTSIQWNDALQQRIIGFFTAIDVQPSNERLKYFGKDTILKYLDSPMGQLPHWDVVKGSMRCKNVAGYSQNLY